MKEIEELIDLTDGDIVISRTKKWSNELQKSLDENQYQVFTRLNCCCAPGDTIFEGIENAKEKIKGWGQVKGA